jgi:hypothetical protein
MEVNISYISINDYNWTNIGCWIWYFRPYKFIRGFNFRIFGIHFNIREKNSFQKLIKQIE